MNKLPTFPIDCFLGPSANNSINQSINQIFSTKEAFTYTTILTIPFITPSQQHLLNNRMSRALGVNSYGNMAVSVADRQHINPMLEGILASTDRKAQLEILRNESRRSSTVNTPDTASLLSSHSEEKRRKSKSSIWSIRGSSRNATTGSSRPLI